MPKPQKTLEDYLSKAKKNPTPHIHFPSKKISSSTSWILRGCKHPKTNSFALDRNAKEGTKNDGHDAATLADIDRFLFENFKSFYINDDDGETKKMGSNEDARGEKTGGVFLESPRLMDPPPDVRSSHRFFAGPGSSSSLMEESRTSITTTSEGMGSNSTTTTTTFSSTSPTTTETITEVSEDAKEVTGANNFIAVFTYSPSPYDDFRHSMEEMIEARLQHQEKVDWEFMEELLFCLLDLNDKKSYKYILSAYVDLITVLRENSGNITASSVKR
ncbi:hypothetical protein Vadar_027255 [Vaccinium darrowii]|uniref:Uncharacterized protein n=1 Tax=Vaccinium darrowii TaxID=229202 RepID=A0ACB7ZM57_9ERIC|nr:hypothetical protein Vadar_027255 [Vaccinium darrowii]